MAHYCQDWEGSPSSWVCKSPVHCSKLLLLPITRINCHCQDEAKLTGTGSRQEVHVGQIEVYRGWTGSPQKPGRKSVSGRQEVHEEEIERPQIHRQQVGSQLGADRKFIGCRQEVDGQKGTRSSTFLVLSSPSLCWLLLEVSREQEEH